MKKLFVIMLLGGSAASIGFLFWTQELKYNLPTPIPLGFNTRSVNEFVHLTSLKGYNKSEPVYLHFFNPECPCSRFNLQHFKSIVKEFEKNVQIYVVIPSYADIERAQKLIDIDHITLIHDQHDSLAVACGVYSTPQAVIVDNKQRLYYRGNYNRARYCTMKESNFAQLALRQLVQGHEPPLFNALATQAYGCELPSNENNSNTLVNILQ